ncbi:MAG: hypothetical protein PHR77_01945 [Kiritimatiellae bacterium]|nr:hypothetical protein [Kiritimatiellia bacterium]MDD5519401.1 hypothetical protein [Kiritimatiellia bacterium]
MSHQKRFYLAAVIILIAGLCSAAFVYLRADAEPVDMTVFEIEHSKKYSRSLLVYAGEMAVLEDEICRWFKSIWHGKPLAYTIACITVVLSCGFYLAGRNLHSWQKLDQILNEDTGKREEG